MAPEDPLLGFARGDARRARHLRMCFQVIAERAPDPNVRRLAGDVLAGRTDPRSALRTPELDGLVAGRIREGLRALPLDDPARMRTLAEQGRAEYLARTEGSLAGPSISTEGSLAGPSISTEGSLAGPSISTEGSLAGPSISTEGSLAGPSISTEGSLAGPSITDPLP